MFHVLTNNHVYIQWGPFGTGYTTTDHNFGNDQVSSAQLHAAHGYICRATLYQHGGGSDTCNTPFQYVTATSVASDNDHVVNLNDHLSCVYVSAQHTPRPTPYPTKRPTPYPTKRPTPYPTKRPTPYPTKRPTPYPTKRPTPHPTALPSTSPTNQPSTTPTTSPTGP